MAAFSTPAGARTSTTCSSTSELDRAALSRVHSVVFRREPQPVCRRASKPKRRSGTGVNRAEHVVHHGGVDVTGHPCHWRRGLRELSKPLCPAPSHIHRTEALILYPQLHLTPREAERLRNVSYQRQVEAGMKNPGNAGLTVQKLGDAQPWAPEVNETEQK